MRGLILKSLVLVAGALAFFALGAISLDLFTNRSGVESAGGRHATAALVSLQDLKDVQAQNAKLAAALAKSDARIEELEKKLGDISQGNGGADSSPSSDVAATKTELEAFRKRLDALEASQGESRQTAESVLQGFKALDQRVQNQGEDASKRQRQFAADIDALHRSLDRVSKDMSVLEKTVQDMKAAPQSKAASAAKPETSAAAKPETSVAAKPEASVAAKPKASVAPKPEASAAGKASGDSTGLKDGVAAYQARDYDAAYRIWKPLADAGDAHAQFYIGALHFEGRGTTRDYAKSCTWLKRASKNGYCCAGSLLDRVRDKLKDRVKAGDKDAGAVLNGQCR